VFARLGKSARGAVARASLARARSGLERLYREAGEQFTRPGGPPLQGEAAKLAEEIQKARDLSRTLAEGLAELREERRKLGGAFGAEGGPAKQIQGLERHIGHIRQELKTLYRRFGEQAAEGANKKHFASLFYEDDKQVLDKIRLIKKTIGDYDGEIQKLKASLEIDAEKAEIEKLKKAVGEERVRIALAEEHIGELEGLVTETEQHIEELKKLL
jgi:chromosome segregation ATPase